MYVCLCKAVTDKEILDAVDSGMSSFVEIREQLGVATVCGSCACAAKELINTQSKQSMADTNSSFYQVA